MQVPRLKIVVGSLVLALGWWLAVHAADPPAAPGTTLPELAETDAAKGGCLKKPLHWSAQPDLVATAKVVWSAYLRFETPAGEKIPARIFLVESHTGPVDRLAGVGHEITVDGGFDPDFEITKERVKKLTDCRYSVNLGTVEFLIQTTKYK